MARKLRLSVSEFANTITVLDMQFGNAYGPCSICAAGEIPPPVGSAMGQVHGSRVDILQVSRTTSNNSPAANNSVVWIDLGPGTNTVRLDNVGLINGGTGVSVYNVYTR